jgi:hypothetical protein
MYDALGYDITTFFVVRDDRADEVEVLLLLLLLFALIRTESYEYGTSVSQSGAPQSAPPICCCVALPVDDVAATTVVAPATSRSSSRLVMMMMMMLDMVDLIVVCCCCTPCQILAAKERRPGSLLPYQKKGTAFKLRGFSHGSFLLWTQTTNQS